MIASESEAINSATYVDNYLDSVENLPDDVQRQLSRIRDIDVQYRGLIRDVDHYYDLYVLHQNSPDTNRRCRSIARMHQSLIQAQELGDEKMQIVNLLQEIIDGKVRQLDTDQQNLDLKEERERYAQLDDGPPSKLQRLQSPMCDQGNSAGNNVLNSSGLGGNAANVSKDHYGALPFIGVSGSSGSGISGNGGSGGGSNSGKKKKRKVRGAGATNTAANTREETPPPEPIDPDEPTYCVCNQISFGEMILCDNDLCPIEWFHFSCVSLVLKPKGKWFCPNCRGERPNVMKPKAQFLKELERYNKEKEEKT
ncbi:PREDICTED: inhibitor of growth protein 1 isoform X2 [Drosophila arizonae]|uniref:Inhibitor of growth protein n=1 Tax=Drosophila arizonae TaxID=7263 RepID=A0ABM1NWV5_DROAR|nr:PREDICTED: inhibitor of growth protein 1 isoform X2 [Drosophila arizonae]